MLRSLICAALLACAGTAQAVLPDSIEQMLQAAHMPDDAIGVVVLRGSTTVLAHNADQSMQPASTMKVLTTMAALELLGPTFRGRTELRSDAEVVNDILRGNLYVRGGADADFNEDALRHMLQTLRSHGIRRIDGDIVFDRQLFQPARPDLGAPPFDEYPDAYYNVIPDALLTNSNLLRIDLDSSGGKMKAALLPELDNVTIRADMKLTDAPCAQWENGWKTPQISSSDDNKLSIVLHGGYPKNCTVSTYLNLIDRDDFLARLFRAEWKQLGGSYAGSVRAAATPAVSRLLAEHLSRTLPEVVYDTNKHSDNTLARTLFLSLGSLQADPALGSRPVTYSDDLTTAARAERTIRDWLHQHGIADQGLVLDNGSGLSRTERISAAQLAGVLQTAQRSLWAPEFAASLPISAIDGTMKRRLKDSPAAMRARLKTGSLNGVIAVAGYVPDADGQPCIVAAIINSNQAGAYGRGILDALIDWVARSYAKEQP